MLRIPAIFAAALIASTPVAAGELVLHTAAELNEFANDISRRYTPFCVTGTVQAVNSTKNNEILIVNDDSGWTEIINLSDNHPTPGEKIALTGQAHMSSRQESDLSAQQISILGVGSIIPPLKLSISEISESAHHLRKITTEGIVIDTFPDEIDSHYQFLLLKDAEYILPVAIHLDPNSRTDFESLRDCRAKATGQFMRTVSGSRKFSGPFIAIDSVADITVIDSGMDDPFSAPPLGKRLYRTPREIAKLGKRSIAGEVLAVWDENRIMVKAEGDRIVNITLAHGQPLPPVGATLIAAGYPETDLFRVNLSRAVVRVGPPPSVRQPETAITDLGAIFNGQYGPNAIDPSSHGQLMHIHGVLQSGPLPNSEQRRILIASESYKLIVDLGAFPDAAEDLEINTELEVSGRCLLETDSWNPEDIFPRIRNVVAVIRTPDDLRIIARPPWWTPMRLLIVISVLLAALIGVYIWNRTLQRLVNRRGRELYREQVAHAVAEFKTGERTRLAVELHDSLSQSLAGVAWQVAASAKTLDSNPTVARRCLETADKMLGSCRTELRQCLFDLRSDTLEEADFSTAIRRTLEQLEGRAAITIRFNVPRQRLKDTTAHAIIAIVRELTGNAIRHGDAGEIKIAGAIEAGRILFSVKDNGKGFDPSACNGPIQGHFGIEGIRNRLEKLSGSLSIESRPGAGTKATVIIPLPPVPHQQ